MKSKCLICLILILIIKITYAAEIDTTIVIQIGGIKQFISIQGKNSENPILLYLHGGPGQAASSKRAIITSKLEEDFVVVHWDQRNTGKTLELNLSKVLVTIDLMKNDAEGVFEHLLKESKRQKIVVVAHSWGNVLGFHLAEKYPKRIHAFISISPDINIQKSQKIALKRLKKYFKKENHDKALKQLSSVKIPHENIEDMIIQYRWQSVYNGEKVTDEILEKHMPFFVDWEKKWMSVYKELSNRNLCIELKEVMCPVYFFVGQKDYTTNFGITERYYKKLKAPFKKIIWLDTSHNIPMIRPDLFQSLIKKHLL